MAGKHLNDSGFHGIRIVSIDNDWSALRFRNVKYIKSAKNLIGYIHFITI